MSTTLGAAGPTGIRVSGNNAALTYAVSRKDVEVSGNGDGLTQKGECRPLKISGEGNHVIVDKTVSRVITDGDNNGNRVEPPREIAPPHPYRPII